MKLIFFIKIKKILILSKKKNILLKMKNMKLNKALNLKYKKNLSLSMNSDLKNSYDFSKTISQNNSIYNSRKKFISTENDIILKSIKNKLLSKHL